MTTRGRRQQRRLASNAPKNVVNNGRFIAVLVGQVQDRKTYFVRINPKQIRFSVFIFSLTQKAERRRVINLQKKRHRPSCRYRDYRSA